LKEGRELRKLLVTAGLLWVLVILPNSNVTVASGGTITNHLVSGGSCLLQGEGRIVSPELGPGNTEVQQAIDPATGYVYEAWIGCNGIGFARSTDGGESFESPYMIPGSGGSASWDPAIAVSGDGVVYVSFIEEQRCFACFGITGSAPFVAVSRDHGATFSTAKEVTNFNDTQLGNELSDRTYIAVAPSGVVYVTFFNEPSVSQAPASTQDQCSLAPAQNNFACGNPYTLGNVVISHSDDEGATWSPLTPVNPGYPNGDAFPTSILVEPNGQIDELYWNMTYLGNSTVGLGHEIFTKSTDGGANWSPGKAIEGGDGSLLNPLGWWIDGSLSRDGSGNLYVSFDTIAASGENAWLTFSHDDGNTWSTPTLVGPAAANGTLNIEAEVSGARQSGAYVSWVEIDPQYHWSLFEETANLTSSGALSQSGVVRVSNTTGAAGVWGGDTTGIGSWNGNPILSWGYGVRENGTYVSEIFEAVPSVSPQGNEGFWSNTLLLWMLGAIVVVFVAVVLLWRSRRAPVAGLEPQVQSAPSHRQEWELHRCPVNQQISGNS
jgi:hypothetical protein